MSDSDLLRLLVERAALLDRAETVAVPGGGSEVRLAGRPFAVVEPARAAFALRPEVAAAALRTPDVRPGSPGPGWVSFAPPILDEFARDRATAWLESAWRLADEDSAGESKAPPVGRRGG